MAQTCLLFVLCFEKQWFVNAFSEQKVVKPTIFIKIQLINGFRMNKLYKSCLALDKASQTTFKSNSQISFGWANHKLCLNCKCWLLWTYQYKRSYKHYVSVCPWCSSTSSPRWSPEDSSSGRTGRRPGKQPRSIGTWCWSEPSQRGQRRGWHRA